MGFVTSHCTIITLLLLCLSNALADKVTVRDIVTEYRSDFILNTDIQHDEHGNILKATSLKNMADAESDRLALIALYNNTNGPEWRDPWNLDDPTGEWEGVTVDENGRVTQLSLIGRGLDGTLPSDICDLTALEVLSISNETQLVGNIPSEIGNLTNLQDLTLSFNRLSGVIPPSLFEITALTRIYISEPQISGTLPEALGNLENLISLSIINTRISGNIPVTIGNLTNLEWLSMPGNQFSGVIPGSIGGLVNLKLLRLDENQLSGEIPFEIGEMANLESLRLSANQLEGNIQSTLGDLMNLNSLSLNNNLLSGGIPASLGNLTKLILLQLDGNRLNGNISTELGNISALVGLYMQNNQLTGEIPPSLENLKNLQVLHLYNNHLSGEIPESLADLTNLMDMNLSGNQFSGDFPPQFGNNTYTELFSSLDVHDNQLTVFPDLTNISSLTQFDVSGNNLSFDDILHNLSLLTRYLPQDSIGVALEVKLNQGDDYSIDLGIDEEITDNVYQWFKDGTEFQTTNVNELILENLTAEDAGVYTCEVTNPGAPGLTLFSRPVTLIINALPIFISTPGVEASEGVDYVYSITAFDPDGSVLTITAPTLPAWLELTDKGDGTATIQGTPQAGDCGDKQVTLLVTDEQGLSGEQSFEINIAVGLNVDLMSDKTGITVGETVTFTANTDYTASAVQYQWFINDVPVPGETTAAFSSHTLENNDKVKVKLVAEPVNCLIQTEAESEEITIIVNEITIPEVQDISRATDEDTELTFKASDFSLAFTGSLAILQITALPMHGTLTLHGASVDVNQEIAVNQLSGLKYIPGADVNGEDTFGWNGSNGNVFAGDGAHVNITIHPINDAPAFTLSGNVFVSKNFTTVEQVTVTPAEVPSDEINQAVAYQLIPPTVSFATIIFDPQSGRVAITSVFDQTGKQEFEIIASDGQVENNIHIESFILEVKANYVFPPKDIAADNLFVPENQPRGTLIGTITVTDDDPDDRHVLTLDDHNTFFFIDGNQLKTNAVLDFEQKATYEVNVRATDLGGNFLIEPFTITVTDENDLPTDLKIIAHEIVENEPIGTQIGKLTAIDQDAGDVLSYTLVAGVADNAFFALSDNVLLSNEVFDFEERAAYEIVVRVEDGNGGVLEEVITIVVIDVEPEEIEVISGFTPDNDRMNDTWEIPGLVSYPRCTVAVYNSWGHQVFFSRGYQKPWDGTDKNGDVQVGTYYYIIDLDNGELPITGNIAVMR